MVLSRQIFINQNTEVFNINFRLKSNSSIFLIVKDKKFWLVSKSLLVRVKYCEILLVNVESQLVGCQPIMKAARSSG